MQSGHRVIADSNYTVSLSSESGEVITLEEAVGRRIVQFQMGFAPPILASLFYAAVGNEVWGRLVFRLAARCEDVPQWNLTRTDTGLALNDAQGNTRAEIIDPLWWRIDDPDVADTFAELLIQQTGLKTRWSVGSQ